MTLSSCSSCRAPTRYLRTDDDRYVSLDRDEDPNGDVVLREIPRPRWTSIVAHVLADGETPSDGATRFRQHRCEERP